jgi:subtilase family serine protease
MILLLALSRAAQADKPVQAPPVEITARPPLHVHPFSTIGSTPYTPSQVRHAYGFDQLASTGAGQTIAIVDAYGSPNVQNDLNTFCQIFGLARPSSRASPPAGYFTFKVYYPQGKPKSTDTGWALETALDVEWAHVIAPGANIVLVAAKSNSYSNLLGAVDYAVNLGATQVSMSWGSSEFSSETGSSYDGHFNRPGVSFVASSGDNGAGVEWPAASPYVTSVGGTTLSLSADGQGTYVSETGWSGSGGGVSSYEAEPGFQSTWQSSGMRAVPDVSYNADPNTGVYVYDTVSYNGQTGWFQVGGTSAGAPQWAALMALANASAFPVSPSNPCLYSAAGNLYSTYFHDITSGSNGSFSAVPNYDLVTGIGSPIASALVPAM